MGFLIVVVVAAVADDNIADDAGGECWKWL
jgi:hypothetical protein